MEVVLFIAGLFTGYVLAKLTVAQALIILLVAGSIFYALLSNNRGQRRW